MPWSIFREGGGHAQAQAWAVDLIHRLSTPLNESTVLFVYQWEVSEGGGGKNNPLNQGPVPGHPELTSTGQQFGGGAADYVSRDDGLEGAFRYLHMPNYVHVLAALTAGDGVAARNALWASPWAASHYGDPGNPGSHWANVPLPNPFTEEDDMFTDADRQMLQEVHNALFRNQEDPAIAGAGLAWDTTQILINTRNIADHLGVPRN